jgi:hypothetical protein
MEREMLIVMKILKVMRVARVVRVTNKMNINNSKFHNSNLNKSIVNRPPHLPSKTSK